MSTTSTALPATTWLVIFAVGALTGMIGQVIRQIASLKKIIDDHPGQPLNLVLDYTRVKINLLIGAAAGILGLISLGVDSKLELDASTIVSLIGIGYAGTDFIESFMRKAQPPGLQGTSTAPPAQPAPASPQLPDPLPLAKG
jgi:hypothetical protein